MIAGSDQVLDLVCRAFEQDGQGFEHDSLLDADRHNGRPGARGRRQLADMAVTLRPAKAGRLAP